MNIVKKLLYFIFNIQEKILLARLKRTVGVKHQSKHKKYYAHGCYLTLDSLAESEKAKIESEMSAILKNASYDPEKLLDYIKYEGTEVFYIENATLLHSIGENEGFIYPQKGGKALYISNLIKKGIQFRTPEMFILTKGEINKFYFIYHFYNWFTFKRGISGMDSESIYLLNKYLFNASDEEINALQLEDIYKLKDAIKQDKAAIDFVINLCKNIEGSRKAMEKLKIIQAKVIYY